MQKWEYMGLLLRTTKGGESSWADEPNLKLGSIERLNVLGKEGWRLAGTGVGTRSVSYVLMRPATSEAEKPRPEISVEKMQQWLDDEREGLTEEELREIDRIAKMFAWEK